MSNNQTNRTFRWFLWIDIGSLFVFFWLNVLGKLTMSVGAISLGYFFLIFTGLIFTVVVLREDGEKPKTKPSGN